MSKVLRLLIFRSGFLSQILQTQARKKIVNDTGNKRMIFFLLLIYQLVNKFVHDQRLFIKVY